MVIEYERTPVKRESDVEEVLFMFRDREKSVLLMEQDKQRTRDTLTQARPTSSNVLIRMDIILMHLQENRYVASSLHVT